MSTSAFVEQLYRTMLGRAAEDAGRAHWVQLIETGTMSAAVVTQHFLGSAEFARAVEPVARLYFAAFNRIPDAAGLRFWVEAAQSGVSLDSIAASFASSPEFIALYGAARDPEFIDLIYQSALGHAPDAPGRAHWIDKIAQGRATRAELLSALASSHEMVEGSSAAIKVVAKYHGITGTAPTRAQIDSALSLDHPITLINELYASSSYRGAQVPHPFVVDSAAASQGGGGSGGSAINTAPVLDLAATTPADEGSVGVMPTIVLAFSQDVRAGASGGVIYITDGAAQTVIDRATGLPKIRIVGATDTRAIDVGDSAHVSFDGGKVTVTVATPLKSGANYSILIGKGVLVGTNDMPFGGIAHTGTLNFTPLGDGVPPAVTSFSLDLNVLKSGHTATMKIVFSEAIGALGADAFDVPNGTLSSFATEDGLTWTALFTPSAVPVDDSSNVMTLRAGSVRDAAGNGNTAAVSSNYAIDTVVSPSVASKLAFIDTGVSATDMLTNVRTQTLAGHVVGQPSGTTLALVINGVSHAVPPSADSNTWSFSGGSFIEGLNSVVAYFTNPAGKKSAERTLSFTLDTQAPELTGGLGATLDAAAPLVLSFNEAVYWKNAGAQLVFESLGGNVTVGQGDITFSADRKTVSIAGANILATGSTYLANLAGALMDSAGNAVVNPVPFATLAPPDLSAPAAPSVLDMLGASDSGASATDNITRSAKPLFNGTLGVAGDIVKLYADGVEVGSSTVAAGGSWEVAPAAALADGSRSMTVRFMDAAGKFSGASAALGITVDTRAPELAGGLAAKVDAAAPLVLSFDEAVYWKDADAQLVFDSPGGNVTVSRDRITFSEDHKTLSIGGANPLAAGSNYSVNLAGALIDASGNAVLNPAPFATLALPDLTAPAAPAALAMLAASDTGSSATDNITRSATPLFNGTLGVAGDIVKLYADGVEVGSSTVAAGGGWEVAPGAALAEGSRSMTVKFMDAAGNLSGASAALGITVDTTAPELTGGLAATVDAAAPLVLSFNEAVYWNTADAQVLFESLGGNVTVGRGDITFSADHKTVTIAGANVLAAGSTYSANLAGVLTDAAGNAPVNPLKFATLALADLTAPAAPSALDMLATSDTGSSATDNITRSVRPVFNGTLGVAGDIVKLYADGVEVGASSVAAGGSWEVAPGAALAEGSRSMTVRFMDAAGNLSGASTALVITVDTTAPTIVRTSPLSNQSTPGNVELTFSEHVMFVNGSIKFNGVLGGLVNAIGVGDLSSWSIANSPLNANQSVLTVDPGLGQGTYRLVLEAGSIVDVAGNAYSEVVGTPVLKFTLSLL